MCDRINQRGWNQWFIPLHVDHNGLVRQAKLGAGLREPITARGMVLIRHDPTHGMRSTGLGDSIMVCGHNHMLPCLTQCSLIGYSHDHWYASNVGQWLVWKTGGRKSGWNQYP